MPTMIDLDKHRTAGEARVARALVDRILEADLYIGIWDGEDWAVPRSQDKTEILRNLGATDDGDVLRISRKEGDQFVRLGKIALIYGNEDDGSELIADYSWTKDNLEHEGIITGFCADL